MWWDFGSPCRGILKGKHILSEGGLFLIALLIVLLMKEKNNGTYTNCTY